MTLLPNFRAGIDDPYVTIIKRPTGGNFIVCGVVSMMLGAIAAFACLFFPTEQYGIVDEVNVAIRGYLLIASGGLSSMGFTLFLIGHVIRALWFLPGEDKKQL
jgi:hypothetical protein